jgi:hypothetical protein
VRLIEERARGVLLLRDLAHPAVQGVERIALEVPAQPEASPERFVEVVPRDDSGVGGVVPNDEAPGIKKMLAQEPAVGSARWRPLTTLGAEEITGGLQKAEGSRRISVAVANPRPCTHPADAARPKEKVHVDEHADAVGVGVGDDRVYLVGQIALVELIWCRLEILPGDGQANDIDAPRRQLLEVGFQRTVRLAGEVEIDCVIHSPQYHHSPGAVANPVGIGMDRQRFQRRWCIGRARVTASGKRNEEGMAARAVRKRAYWRSISALTNCRISGSVTSSARPVKCTARSSAQAFSGLDQEADVRVALQTLGQLGVRCIGKRRRVVADTNSSLARG